MMKNQDNKDWVRRMLKQTPRKHKSKELDKLVKNAAKDLSSSMMKIFKPEYFRSDLQRIVFQLEQEPAKLLLGTEEFDDDSLRIYELNQLHQFQHLPFYLKLKTASMHNPIAVQLNISIENKIEQEDINQMLLLKITEDPKIADNFVKFSFLTKEVLDQKKTFLDEMAKSKKMGTLLTSSNLQLPKEFDDKLFFDYLKVIPSLSDTYISSVLTIVANLNSRTGEPKYTNFLNKASRTIFSGNQDQYERTQIDRITRDHFLYQSYLFHSSEKFPLKKTVADHDDWCQKDSGRKILSYYTVKNIIGLYKTFHKLFEDIYFLGDTDFINFLAWTRKQISKETGLEVSI